MIVIACDIARSGEDKSVAAIRQDNAIIKIQRWHKADTMETVGRIVGLINLYKPDRVVIDVIGIGAGVYDRLKEMKYPVVPFNAAERTDETDKSKQFGFLNKRAASWWKLRELLDPSAGSEVMLPNDDYLIGDLTAPHWKVASGGKIQVESKDEIKARIGRSTDTGDAVVMAFYEGANRAIPGWWLHEKGVA